MKKQEFLPIGKTDIYNVLPTGGIYAETLIEIQKKNKNRGGRKPLKE